MDKGRKGLVVPALLALAVSSITFQGCADSGADANLSTTAGFERISQTEALSMMERETGYVILDVRTKSEYEQGHIPGAINLPVEEIGNEPPSQLPDKDQLIMVYCRSGNRSVVASEKLSDLGYANIVEFGGISTWPGDITPG